MKTSKPNAREAFGHFWRQLSDLAQKPWGECIYGIGTLKKNIFQSKGAKSNSRYVGQ